MVECKAFFPPGEAESLAENAEYQIRSEKKSDCLQSGLPTRSKMDKIGPEVHYLEARVPDTCDVCGLVGIPWLFRALGVEKVRIEEFFGN